MKVITIADTDSKPVFRIRSTGLLIRIWILLFSSVAFKGTQDRDFFLASILKFVLFLCYLCQNIKILPKKFFDQAIIGGGTIFPRSLKTTRNEKKF
jgi:hypothetical protein